MTWLTFLAAYLGSSVIGSWLVVGFFRAGAQSERPTQPLHQPTSISKPDLLRGVGGNRVHTPSTTSQTGTE